VLLEEQERRSVRKNKKQGVLHSLPEVSDVITGSNKQRIEVAILKLRELLQPHILRRTK